MVTVAILGGGISGLSAAYYLGKLARSKTISKVILLEASSRLGGCIDTVRLDDGTIFERGPRSIRGQGAQGYNTLQLAEELGLSDQVLPINRSHQATKNRFIYVNRELCRLPSGPSSLLTRQPPFSKSLLRLGWREPFVASHKVDDETIDSFFRRRFGDEIAKYAIDPLCRGIYSGSSQQLSVKACFPQLLKWEQQYHSIVKGALLAPKKKAPDAQGSRLVERYKSEHWSMWSLDTGLQKLPETLAVKLRQSDCVDICLDTPCTGLEFSDTTGKVKVKMSDKEEEVDYVFSALPARHFAALLPFRHHQLAALLRHNPSVSVGVVNLQYEGNVLSTQGFGHLVPSCEPSKVLGVLYESCIFPVHNRHKGDNTRITCMMGGAWFKEMFGEADDVDPQEFGEIAVDSIREQLHINKKPFRVIAGVVKNCIPQYQVGHTQSLQDMSTYITQQSLPLSLIGASYEGVSINDCIHNTRIEVEKVLPSIEAMAQ